ncbi:MAG: peptidoglycan editing factor PgeF [Aestuariivita sp.]|nr:peptidoglycan editing factor PgeF [Aestuariivita sp.]
MIVRVVETDILKRFRHGFFTRVGGTSSSVFSGLNCAYNVGDRMRCVYMNRKSVALHMKVNPPDLIGVHQTHSTDVAVIRKAGDGKKPADAMVTDSRKVVLTVLTADCQPVLFGDIKAGVIAIAHAGWRGSFGGILENTLAKMESLGAERKRIAVAIGPSITQPAYEIGPEFLTTFLNDDPNNERFFKKGDGDRYLFDLQAYSMKRLNIAGIESVHWVDECTYLQPDRFFSYRRSQKNNETQYGRQMTAIGL